MLFDIIATALGGLFGMWLLSFVVSGVRTGRIYNTNSTSTYSLRRQPVRFIVVAAGFSLVGGTIVYVATHRALAIWESLPP